MAQVESQGNQKGRPKRSPKIDMTAMVDVAFLLLTFFILTTTLAQPRAMTFVQPAGGEGGEMQCSKVVQVYLGEDDKIYWFPSCNPESLQETDYSSAGLRNVILENIAIREDIVFSIKPLEKSNYKNFVDAFDELKITGAKRYALAPLSPEDIELLSLKGLK